MRGIRLVGLLLFLVMHRCQNAYAQRLYQPAVASPLSAYEEHPGTVTSTRGRTQPALVKLVLTTDRNAPRRARRYATVRVQVVGDAPIRADSVASFTFDRRRFVNLNRLTPDRALRQDLETEFVEVFADTGRIELYGFYPTRGNRFALTSFVPGVIHEDDLVQYFIWRRWGTPGFAVMAHVPPRGYNDEFEAQLRTLFADRPDILKYIESHDVRRVDLPAAVRAYNAGVPFRFE